MKLAQLVMTSIMVFSCGPEISNTRSVDLTQDESQNEPTEQTELKFKMALMSATTLVMSEL